MCNMLIVNFYVFVNPAESSLCFLAISNEEILMF